MSDFSLKGTNGAEIFVRKIKDNNLTVHQIHDTIKSKENDEIIVNDEKGDKYLIYADNLTYKDGKVGLGSVYGAANPNVAFFNDQVDEDANTGIVSMISSAISGSGSGTIAGMAREADFQRKINSISEPVSDEVKNNILKSIK